MARRPAPAPVRLDPGLHEDNRPIQEGLGLQAEQHTEVSPPALAADVGEPGHDGPVHLVTVAEVSLDLAISRLQDEAREIHHPPSPMRDAVSACLNSGERS